MAIDPSVRGLLSSTKDDVLASEAATYAFCAKAWHLEHALRRLRGVRGVQQVVDRYWRRGAAYYLGEWHFHPFAEPELSDLDRWSMRGIAASLLYNCPEPIVLLIGGDPAGDWNASAWAFRRGNSPVLLKRSLPDATDPPAG
jgi:hypothetical protein